MSDTNKEKNKAERIEQPNLPRFMRKYKYKKGSAFVKNITRSLTGNLSRFLAVFAIIALGAGVYTGLKAFVPDMYYSGDNYFDETNLADIRISSTLGFDQDNLDAIREVPGVRSISEAITTEVTASNGVSSYQIALTGIDMERARNNSGYKSPYEGDPDYLNRLDVKKGRLPEKPNEIVINYDSNQDLSIGDKLTFESIYGHDKVKDFLAYDTFEIVGFVESPEYFSESLDVSPMSGILLSNFGYVDHSAFADPELYTDVSVSAEGALEETSLTDEYNAVVSKTKKEIHKIAQDQADARADKIKDEAQEKIDDAQKELDDAQETFDTEIANAEAEIADGEQKLKDSRKKVKDGEAEIASNEKKLKDAKAKLDKSRQELDNGWSKYNQGKKEYEDSYPQASQKLKDAQAKIDDGKAQLDAAKKELDNAESQLSAAETEANAGLKELNSKLSELKKSLFKINKKITALSKIEEPTPEQTQQLAVLQAKKAEIEGTIPVLEEKINGLNYTIENELKPKRQKLEASKSEYAKQVEEKTPELEQGQEQIDQGWAELNSAKKQLENSKAKLTSGESQYKSGLQEYKDGVAKLNKAKKDLEQGKREIKEGEADLQKGKEELEKNRKEGEKELLDGKRKIIDAQKELDDIEEPLWFILDRMANPAYNSYYTNAGRVDQITKIFPIFFFLVAALVVLTTMTRMVESERVEIGTLKALGFKPSKISRKYTAFALLASVLGSAVGILAFTFTLPEAIWIPYQTAFLNPDFETGIHGFDWLFASVLSIAITLFATWSAAKYTLREKPSTLMQPRAPKPGKRILLERIRPLWDRLSFSQKVTARNIFRYKKRLFMTVIGVAGCTALLLAGFGIQDKLDGFIEYQYYDLQQYDLAVNFDPDVDEKAARGDNDSPVAQDIKENTPEDSPFIFVKTHNAIAENPNGSPDDVPFGIGGDESRTGGSMQAKLREGRSDRDPSDKDQPGLLRDIALIVPEEPDKINDFYQLLDYKDNTRCELKDGSVVIPERLAEVMQLEVGDDIYIALDSESEAKPVPISAIVKTQVLHNVFLSPKTYEDLFNEKPKYNTAYVKHGGTFEEREVDGSAIRSQNAAVDSTMVPENVAAIWENLTESLSAIVILIIVVSAALAFTVLYNLTNINIEEREREIATIKVLGFYPKEVNMYIFRETFFLSAVGTIVGLPLGVLLCSYIMRSAELDNVMFFRTIDPSSYVYATLLTLLFTVIVMLILSKKLKKIDMASSLQSSE